MLNNFKNYRAERAKRKILSQDPKKSKFRKLNFAAICGVVLAMSALVYGICFVNKAPTIPHMVSKSKMAQVQVISPFDFSYKSEIQTQLNRERNAEKIPPYYKTNAASIAAESNNIKKLTSILSENRKKFDGLDDAEKKSGKFFGEISAEIRKSANISVSPYDIKTIYERTSAENMARTFNQTAFHLENILRDGIYADGDAIFSTNAGMPLDLQGELNASGLRAGDSNILEMFKLRAVSESDARREFLEKVKTLGLSEQLAYALYRTMNQALRPNVEFDEENTKKRRDEARSKVGDVIVKIRAGDTLVDSDTTPSPLITEKIKAYKAELQKRGTTSTLKTSSVEFIFCLLLMTMGALFLVISKTQKNKRPRTIAIFCTLLLLNLALERALVEMGNAEYFDSNTPMMQILAYVAPIMLGPIIQVLLFGSYTGFIMALMVAALTTAMVGEGIIYFAIFLASALVAIYFCAGASTRPQVILGGVIYGLFIAAISFVIGNCVGLSISIVWRQSLLAVGSGALTGLVALAVLPLVERIFNRYSNITLLDYTDFNNPLLRRLQIEAPGTYHHSVMVSYLAEAAAVAVNANPMVCRVGSLYHDIGKIQKPEFFTENQGGGKNAHDEKNPSMSALIIKNHIREGAEIAKIAKLPKQIIDAIDQHHGKSIVSYFYYKAQEMAKANGIKDPLQALRDAGIEESTYRYEGTLPQTVENAIIMIADSCEAASRSLKHITQHGIEEKVSSIIRSKMTDGQLDECPITVKQLSKIKSSIVATMLNMLHTRVAYINDKQ